MEMINETTTKAKFLIPITSSMKERAISVSSQHVNLKRQTSIYHRAIALQGIKFYCQIMDIDCDIESSQFWDSTFQVLSDATTFRLTDFGSCECCVTLDSEDSVVISPEAIFDRLGYFAIEINETKGYIELIGFLENIAAQASVPKESWSSIDNLFELLDQHSFSSQISHSPIHVRTENLSSSSLKSSPSIVRLRDWLETTIKDRWTSLEDTWSTPALAFRSSLHSKSTATKRAKVIELESLNVPVIVIIGIEPQAESHAPEWNISLEVFSSNPDIHLPYDLNVSVLDEANEIVMQASTREAEELCLMFSAEEEEYFKLQFSAGSSSLTEVFVV